MRQLFVYYRVREDRATLAEPAVHAMQASLRQAFPGLDARLLRRPPQSGVPQTWMEIYAMVAADAHGVGPEVQRQIEAAALPVLRFLDGPRHVEVFVPMCVGDSVAPATGPPAKP